MANKLFLISATLAFFFLLTNASIYRTVVEFDEDDATNPIGPQKKCMKEFQQAQHLVACQEWIQRRAMQPGGGPSLALDDEFDFEDDIENPHGPQQRPRLLQMCCNELHQEDPVCVCPTLKRAAKAVRSQVQQEQQQGQQGQGQPQVVSRIFQTAKHLPTVCRVPKISVCPFKQAMPFYPPYY